MNIYMKNGKLIQVNGSTEEEFGKMMMIMNQRDDYIVVQGKLWIRKSEIAVVELVKEDQNGEEAVKCDGDERA